MYQFYKRQIKKEFKTKNKEFLKYGLNKKQFDYYSKKVKKIRNKGVKMNIPLYLNLIKNKKLNKFINEQKKINAIKTKLKKYNINGDEYEKMFILYKNCNICQVSFSKKLKPVIDHCHATGKVRGLLCNYCNLALGLFKDNTTTLSKAIEYINLNNPVSKLD